MTTRHYIGIAESDGNGWSLGFPAFPGTVTTGETLAEFLCHARDALASVVGAMEQDGLALPASVDTDPLSRPVDLAGYVDPRIVIVPVETSCKAAPINVTMDEGLVARLDSLAERSQDSRSALLARGARMVLAAAEAAD